MNPERWQQMRDLLEQALELARTARGTIDGDTWTWIDDGKITHGRFTEKTVNPDMATYTYEVAHGSEPWTLVTEGKQTRQK
jgi:hypothetical protein